MGGGQQYVSWMHETDFCRAVPWRVHHEEFSGPVNLTAPNPLTNADMMQTFRRAVGSPFGLPATKWMMEIGAFFLRTETELMIKSRRVVPVRLLQSGFVFKFPRLEDAVREIEARVAHS
jgi:NAD dependent epimerase/dehydratase family enzyme